jgi:hypothetical protein
MSRSRDLKSFLVDLTVYGALVFAYFILVLRFFGGWLTELYEHHRMGYAIVAILFMVMQAAGLEIASHFILKLIRGKKS